MLEPSRRSKEFSRLIDQTSLMIRGHRVNDFDSTPVVWTTEVRVPFRWAAFKCTETICDHIVHKVPTPGTDVVSMSKHFIFTHRSTDEK